MKHRQVKSLFHSAKSTNIDFHDQNKLTRYKGKSPTNFQFLSYVSLEPRYN